MQTETIIVIAYAVGIIIVMIIGVVMAIQEDDPDNLLVGFICGLLWPVVVLIGIGVECKELFLKIYPTLERIYFSRETKKRKKKAEYWRQKALMEEHDTSTES